MAPPRLPPALAISAMTTASYAGVLAGAAVIGFVSAAIGLHNAIWMLAMSFFLVPPTARFVAVGSTTKRPQRQRANKFVVLRPQHDNSITKTVAIAPLRQCEHLAPLGEWLACDTAGCVAAMIWEDETQARARCRSDRLRRRKTRMERHYGWVIVAVGALMGCIGMGSMFSLAVFLDPIAAGTGWSRAGISASMTVAFLAMGVGAFGWGWVCDRHGPRMVGVAGGLLLGTGLVLASRATSLLAFQLAHGLFLGAAVGAFFAPMMATASAWCDRHHALAVSLVSAGLGIAPVTVAPFAQGLLLSGYD